VVEFFIARPENVIYMNPYMPHCLNRLRPLSAIYRIQKSCFLLQEPAAY
jgi:hypothetical protein